MTKPVGIVGDRGGFCADCVYTKVFGIIPLSVLLVLLILLLVVLIAAVVLLVLVLILVALIVLIILVVLLILLLIVLVAHDLTSFHFTRIVFLIWWKTMQEKSIKMKKEKIICC